MGIPDALITTYPDGETSATYLELCNPTGLVLITPEQVAAAAHLPHAARAAFFTSVAGAIPTPAEPPVGAPIADRIAADSVAGPEAFGQDANPRTETDDADKAQAKREADEEKQPATGPKRWTPKAKAAALVMGKAFVAAGLTAEQILAHPEVIEMATAMRTTGGTVYARMAEQVVGLPPLPGAATAAVESGRWSGDPGPVVDTSDVVDETPKTWAYDFPGPVGGRHVVKHSCCRWFIVTHTADGRYSVPDVARTRSEAEAMRTKLQAETDPAGELAWQIIEATAVPTEDRPPASPPAELPHGAGELLVPPPVADSVDAIFAPPPPLEDPMTVIDHPADIPPPPEVDAAPVGPDPGEPEAPPTPAEVEEARTPLAPTYTYADFAADFLSASDDGQAPPDAAFMVDSLDRLGWYGRKLSGFAGELAALEASYKAAKASITKKQAAFENWFGPQAKGFAAGILAADGWKVKTLKTLGGDFAFRTENDRLEQIDKAAALDWAKANMPEAVRQTIAESVVYKAVETNWRENGEIPPGYDLIIGGEAFRWSPRKVGA